MKLFTIHITYEARKNILDYINHIQFCYKMPITAVRHYDALYERIFSLSTYAQSIRVSDKQDVLRFGASARAIQYKKMAIIYTVHDNRVIIRAVIPASLIKK